MLVEAHPDWLTGCQLTSSRGIFCGGGIEKKGISRGKNIYKTRNQLVLGNVTFGQFLLYMIKPCTVALGRPHGIKPGMMEHVNIYTDLFLNIDEHNLSFWGLYYCTHAAD